MFNIFIVAATSESLSVDRKSIMTLAVIAKLLVTRRRASDKGPPIFDMSGATHDRSRISR